MKKGENTSLKKAQYYFSSDIEWNITEDPRWKIILKNQPLFLRLYLKIKRGRLFQRPH